MKYMDTEPVLGHDADFIPMHEGTSVYHATGFTGKVVAKGLEGDVIVWAEDTTNALMYSIEDELRVTHAG